MTIQILSTQLHEEIPKAEGENLSLQALYRSPLMTVELSTEEAVRDFLVDVLLESVETTSNLATVVSVCCLTPALLMRYRFFCRKHAK